MGREVTFLIAMDPMQLLVTVLSGAAAGVVYAVIGYRTKRDAGEPFNSRKFLRSVALFAVAGALVAARQGTVTEPDLEQAATEAAIVGVLFDMLWSWAKRAGYLPEPLLSPGS